MLEETRNLMNDWLIAYPPKTAVEYRRDFEDYAEWLDEEDPLEADRARIQRHLAYLSDHGLAPSTVRRHTSAISSFYRYAFTEKLIDHNPATHVRRPKGQADPKRGLTIDQAHELLAAAREHSRAAHALVWLMAGVGLRLAEACSLDIEHISGETLTVTTKGGHRQTKPFIGSTRAAVLEAIDNRTEGPVLTNSERNRLARRPAWQLITQLADHCGIDGCTPHTLRHTAATLALEAGAPIEDVQQLLGHRSLETTLRYVHNRDLAKAARNAAERLGQVLAGEVWV